MKEVIKEEYKEEIQIDTEETQNGTSVIRQPKKKFSWINLISENGHSPSIGRIAFWVGLGVALYYWIWLPIIPFPESLMDFLGYVLAYNCAKKGIHSYSNIKNRDITERYHTSTNCSTPRSSQRRRSSDFAKSEDEFDRSDFLKE